MGCFFFLGEVTLKDCIECALEGLYREYGERLPHYDKHDAMHVLLSMHLLSRDASENDLGFRV